MFLNLPFKDIMACQLVNRSSKELLANPIFWIRKWGLKGLSKKNQDDWIKAIRLTKNNTKLTGIIVSYIKKVLYKDHFFDIPCYIHEKNVDKVFKFAEMDAGSIQIFIGLTNMNISRYVMKSLQRRFGKSAHDGGKDIVQVLAPFMGNANEIVTGIGENTRERMTPIDQAIKNGHTEIIKLLAPLCDDYNLQGNLWSGSLIHYAVLYGQAEAIEILAPFMKNPNAEDNYGLTPIALARAMGFGPNHDVIQILEKLQ